MPSFTLPESVASEFDQVAELHADPDGFGIDEEERGLNAQIVACWNGADRFTAPSDPDVADALASHLTDLANGKDEEYEHRVGEGANPENREHVRRARSGLGTLATKLRRHARQLRAAGR